MWVDTKVNGSFVAEPEQQQVIQQPNRINKTTDKTTDLAHININHCNNAGVFNYKITDHKPIYIIKKKIRHDKRITTCCGHSYRNYNFNELAGTLEEINSTGFLEMKDLTNVGQW